MIDATGQSDMFTDTMIECRQVANGKYHFSDRDSTNTTMLFLNVEVDLVGRVQCGVVLETVKKDKCEKLIGGEHG